MYCPQFFKMFLRISIVAIIWKMSAATGKFSSPYQTVAWFDILSNIKKI